MQLLGCTTVPDEPYHTICNGEPTCSDASLEAAVKVRRDVLIDRYGWNACLTDKYSHLRGRHVVVKATKCDEEQLTNNVPTPYAEAWMEYNIAGEAHDHWQRDAILKWIQSGTGPVYVVIYIHGWHHNASTCDGDPYNNAIMFPMLMARQVDTLRRLEMSKQLSMPAVLGVYVGWSEEKYVHAGLPGLWSIGSRSEVADRIGQRVILKEDLLAIATAVRNRSGNDGHTLVIGHSLGGRMLTTMFNDELNHGESQPLGPGSLIATINAAVGADCFDGVLSDKGINPEGPRPTWMNVTSKNDTAAGWPYELATTVCLVKSCNSQSEAHKKTVGHYSPYLKQVVDNARHLGDGPAPITECGKKNPVSRADTAQIFELNWFHEPKTMLMAFPYRDNRALNERSTSCYSVHLSMENKVPEAALKKTVWNIRSDESLIDRSVKGGGIDGHHNG